VVQELVSLLDLGLQPGEALAQARIHQQWLPDELVVEKALPKDVKAALATYGHNLREVDAMGASQIIARRPNKVFSGGSDPRVQGKAAAF
jgi:gamma-glutamyltranspeptidase/glutathione hydrolase